MLHSPDFLHEIIKLYNHLIRTSQDPKDKAYWKKNLKRAGRRLYKAIESEKLGNTVWL